MNLPTITKPASRPAASAARPAAVPVGGRPAVASTFSMSLKNQPSLNEGGFRDLPEGRFVYIITKFEKSPVKSDPTGRQYKLSLYVDQRLPGDQKASFIYNFNVCSDNTVAREIAFKGLTALAVDALGFTSDNLSEKQFGLFAGKDIVIEMRGRDRMNPVTKKMEHKVNLNRIEKPTEADYAYLLDEDEEETPEEAPETTEDVSEDAPEDTEAEAPADEQEATAEPETPAVTAPAAMPWDKKKKTKS